MKARVVKAPEKWKKDRPTIFLAGSIDMGSAEDWQSRITNLLSHLPITILNPRRDDWDSSWEQSIDNPQFREQVEWELKGQELADVVVFYFDKKGKSPITLMELGLFHDKGIVYCPEGFWRKGNVDVVCNRYGVKIADSIETLAKLAVDELYKDER